VLILTMSRLSIVRAIVLLVKKRLIVKEKLFLVLILI